MSWGIMSECRCLLATTYVRDWGMNVLPVEDNSSQVQFGLGHRWERETVTLSGQFAWYQCQLFLKRWCHTAEPENVKLQSCAKEQESSESVLKPGTHHLWYWHALKIKCKSEREQRLGERSRPLRISSIKRTLLDDGCEVRPLPCAADQELRRGTQAQPYFPWRFTKWEGTANCLRSN